MKINILFRRSEAVHKIAWGKNELSCFLSIQAVVIDRASGGVSFN